MLEKLSLWGLSLLQPGASAWSQSYGYDGARRLTNSSSPAGSFTYGYDSARHQQINKLLLPNGAYITNAFDTVSRLLSTTLKNNGNTALNSHSYWYNAGNQRTALTNFAGDYRLYTYDSIGRLKTAIGKESSGTARLLEQLGYAYDAADNLNFRTNNALIDTFNVNTLNELSTITHSGTLTVAGTTTTNATSVTVNGSLANRYSDATFALGGFTVVNGNNTFTAGAKDALGRTDTNSITVNLPATVTCTYDLNGNLTSDGTRGFDYDDENQLIRVTVTNSWKTEFAYDGKMRRRIRTECTWSGTSWLTNTAIRYVYDGQVVIQERDTNNLPWATYTRGNDLSRTLQGAGGIGGLLARTDAGFLTVGYSGAHAYYHADGNGNITALINTNQAVVAKYLYDPVGHILSQSGWLADANLYRFSSQEFHKNSGLVHYLYRYYEPNLQRWVNRDPHGEPGFELVRKSREAATSGPNLYTLLRNNSINTIDPWGLKIWVCTVRTSGFPLYGLGRHAYFWDDRSGKEYGQEGSSGSGGNTSGNTGPKAGDPGNSWHGDGGRGDTECYPVDGSTGKEDAVMNCCKQNANKGVWFPGINDCHTKVDECLGSNGLTSPPRRGGVPPVDIPPDWPPSQ